MQEIIANKKNTIRPVVHNELLNTDAYAATQHFPGSLKKLQ